MSGVIQFSGDIQFKLTIDPSVWIFDDRKIELEQCFYIMDKITEEDNEAYTEKMSKQWEEATTEGAKIYPPVNKSVGGRDRDKLLSSSFVMPIRPFIENAEPHNNVKKVEILQKDGSSIEVDFLKIKTAFLCFSMDGKPLTEDGPVHLYFKDGSNKEDPIKNIQSFVFQT